jgi:cellobiose phosphorylase
MQTKTDRLAPHDDVCFTAHLLSNGRYSTLVSASGGGYSALDGYALTRWVPDPTCDADGTHIYVRDVESGVFWTPAGGPVPPDDGHTFHCDGGTIEMRSSAHRIECATSICVSHAHDAELRRLTIRNDDAVARVLEAVRADGARPGSQCAAGVAPTAEPS